MRRAIRRNHIGSDIIETYTDSVSSRLDVIEMIVSRRVGNRCLRAVQQYGDTRRRQIGLGVKSIVKIEIQIDTPKNRAIRQRIGVGSDDQVLVAPEQQWSRHCPSHLTVVGRSGVSKLQRLT